MDSDSEAGSSIQVPPQTPSSKLTPKPKFDPFENPSDELLVGRVPTAANHSHTLVLNKFPVISNHFILATKESKPQDHPLEVDDLSLTYECIKAWQDVDGLEIKPTSSASLFAFFNSGIHSGASQPHRHVQFLPVEDMDTHRDDNWSLLVNSMTAKYRPHLDLLVNPSLSIVHYSVDIKPGISPQELHDKYIYLLRSSWATLAFGTADIDTSDLGRIDITQALDNNHVPVKSSQDVPKYQQLGGKVGFDYNLCLTIDKMAIIPRLQGDATVPLANPDDDNRLSVNGTILAGTLMTKSEKQWQLLNEKPELLQDLLKQVGYPKPMQASL